MDTSVHQQALAACRHHFADPSCGRGHGEDFAGSVGWQLHLDLCSLPAWTAALELDQLLWWRWLLLVLEDLLLVLVLVLEMNDWLLVGIQKDLLWVLAWVKMKEIRPLLSLLWRIGRRETSGHWWPVRRPGRKVGARLETRCHAGQCVAQNAVLEDRHANLELGRRCVVMAVIMVEPGGRAIVTQVVGIAASSLAWVRTSCYSRGVRKRDTYTTVGTGRIVDKHPVWAIVREKVLAPVLVETAAAAHDGQV